MCPEYGATVGYFPVDENSLNYLRQTSRTEEKIALVHDYLAATRQLRNYDDESQDPNYTQVQKKNHS